MLTASFAAFLVVQPIPTGYRVETSLLNRHVP